MESIEMLEDYSMITNRSANIRSFFFGTVTAMVTAFLFMGITVMHAQVDSFEVEFNKQYEKNIKKERLFGVYIPRDMEDAFVELERLSDKVSIDKFRSADEDDVATKLHFGLGNWMIVNWRFYEGSRFSHYLKLMGVSHPDDMAQYTIVSWHRKLNGKPLEMEERAQRYRDLRKKIAGIRDSVKLDSLRSPE